MFEIDPQIKKAASKCSKKQACLNKKGKELCEVKYSVEDKVHFLVCLCDDNCPYKEFFGREVFCACPIRKEMYNKYKV